MNATAQVSRLLRLIGIDRAIGWTLIGRGWSALAGPVTLLLVASFLSPEEQGFYYVFGNILGLQIFFELGLSYVILQFASHEKAKLEWSQGGILEGDAITKGRLASLFRRGLIWYGTSAVLVIAVVLPAGLVFFERYQPVGVSVEWQFPWIWVVLASAGALFVSPIFAVLEGCGLVAEVALMRVGQSIGGNLVLWLALWQQWGLFANAAIATFGLLWGLAWLWLYKRSFLLDLVSTSSKEASISWWSEVWPFQWKIALSWLSGYFIFQLFNPVLFAFHGPVVAGQMGMSLNVMTAITIMALAWVNTKAAPFGILIARRQFKELDRLFFPCLWQSFSLVVLAGTAFWLAGFYLYATGHPFSQRILGPLPLGLLVLTAVLNHIVFAEGLYLRAHKQEPFLWISILIACLTVLSTYFLGRQFGAVGMMTGYFLVNVVLGLGVGTWIFRQKRRLWHTK